MLRKTDFFQENAALNAELYFIVDAFSMLETRTLLSRWTSEPCGQTQSMTLQKPMEVWSP